MCLIDCCWILRNHESIPKRR